MNDFELHAWSRHYDTLVWTVTGIFAGADGGLLLYAFSTEKPAWIVCVIGISLTVLAVYFIASFRSARRIVHSKMKDEDIQIARGAPFLKQWRIFVLFWVAMLCFWFGLLIYNYTLRFFLWLVLGFIILLFMLISAYLADYVPKKKRGS